MTQRIDIGIDGGGTGCRVALSVGGGPVTLTTGGPANIVSDPAGAEASIRQALMAALARHDLGPEALSRARICAGLAGGRLPGAADAFAARLPWPVHVVDDSVTALEGALGGGDGSLASLGTGSFFITRQDGVIRHQGGWGFALGDEGGAAWGGRMALSLALKVADGRRPPDPLADALMRACAPHPVLWAQSARPGDFAELMRLVADHPESPIARHVQGAIRDALIQGLRDLGHVPGQPLVITGGLGARMARLLPDDLASGLRPAQGQALDGALSLARAMP